MSYEIDNGMGVSEFGLQMGAYSDKYFINTATILKQAEEANSTEPIEVEAQIFTRPKNRVVVGGINLCIEILKRMTGEWYQEDDYRRENPPDIYWSSTYHNLEIEAVQDGTFVEYYGDPKDVMPVMKIRGIYRDFAAAETVILGILAHVSRVATNVYNVLIAAQGKPVMFYPARFDIPEAQYYDGLAYKIAIDAYNMEQGWHGYDPIVSTDMQALSFGGTASGTSPHSLIAAFKGNSVEAMHHYAMSLPSDTKRVHLADFHNDCADDAIKVASYYFQMFLAAKEVGNKEDMKRWTLYGIRLDTSGSHVDLGLLRAGFKDVKENRGVTKDLVRLVRSELDAYAHREYFATENSDIAWNYFSEIKIIVTGGFNVEKITDFLKYDVPVDIFGVGSSLLKNDDDTNCDFTMDVVRVKVGNEWQDVAKVGRAACYFRALQTIK